MVVSAANSAARKRPRTSEQGPRAVEDQTVQAAPRPGGPDSDEHGSELRANADSTANGLAAVDLDEADLDSEADFDDLDADAADLTDDAELQAALADEDLDVGDLSEDGEGVAGPGKAWPWKTWPGGLAGDDGRKARTDRTRPRRTSRPRQVAAGAGRRRRGERHGRQDRSGWHQRGRGDLRLR